MKKVILIALSLVLALGCVASFAWHGPCDQELCPVGGSINDPEQKSDTNLIREDHTPSRGLPNALNTAIWQEADDYSKGKYAKATSTTFLATDNGSSSDSYFTVDLKANKLGDFCGVIYDEKVVVGSTNAASLDSLTAMELVDGYGFTLVDATTIKVFINDVTTFYATFALDFDASEAWHTYKIVKEASTDITFAIDNLVLCKIDFERGKLYNAAGDVVCEGFANITDDTASVFFGVIGDDVDVDFDNIGITNPQDIYEYEGNSEATLIVSSNPPEVVDATEAPAQTINPATEAPATEAPDDSNVDTDITPDSEKKGCGSIIGAGAVLVLAGCAIVLKKKD